MSSNMLRNTIRDKCICKKMEVAPIEDNHLDGLGIFNKANK